MDPMMHVFNMLHARVSVLTSEVVVAGWVCVSAPEIEPRHAVALDSRERKMGQRAKNGNKRHVNGRKTSYVLQNLRVFFFFNFYIGYLR
ncbi:hypothetical protein NC652_021348 [Populus alba x Populus x berolinensis]|nr:hypothetical protein NC652_021348 [Populus alba x Populus x berolinensis]